MCERACVRLDLGDVDLESQVDATPLAEEVPQHVLVKELVKLVIVDALAKGLLVVPGFVLGVKVPTGGGGGGGRESRVRARRRRGKRKTERVGQKERERDRQGETEGQTGRDREGQ